MVDGLNPSSDASLGPAGLQVEHKEPSMAYLVEEHVLHRLRLFVREDLAALLSQQAQQFSRELASVHSLQKTLSDTTIITHQRLDRYEARLQEYELRLQSMETILHRLDWLHRLWMWIKAKGGF